MILDSLENCNAYRNVHPGFPEAFAFLAALDRNTLVPGRIEIAGERLYALVVDADGKGEAGALLETHRTYIDIQCQVAGADHIGWAAANRLRGDGYVPEKDLELYASAPETWVDTPPCRFAVFFPNDAHAPMGGTGRLVKVVVKVKAEWP
jgi:YhcH/YjgK/YiaL family protein